MPCDHEDRAALKALILKLKAGQPADHSLADLCDDPVRQQIGELIARAANNKFRNR